MKLHNQDLLISRFAHTDAVAKIPMEGRHEGEQTKKSDFGGDGFVPYVQTLKPA